MACINEYDVDVIDQPAWAGASQWLKLLQLRGRYGLVNRYLASSATMINDYRLILNYVVTLR